MSKRPQKDKEGGFNPKRSKAEKSDKSKEEREEEEEENDLVQKLIKVGLNQEQAKGLVFNTLTSLALGLNEIGDAGAAALAEALEQNSTLTSLDLRGNQIGDAGAAALAEALKQNRTLTSLDLGGNEIGVAGAAALAEALKQNSIITSLDLRGNEIGDAGTALLAKALEQNRTITSLTLGSNAISDAGAEVLAEALKQNSTLTSLDLGSNAISDAGAEALAEALKQNNTITSLDLGLNEVGDYGAAKLAKALEQNSTITSLDLRDNRIGDAGAEALAEALKQNNTITSLDLRDNRIGAASVETLTLVINRNCKLVEKLAQFIIDKFAFESPIITPEEYPALKFYQNVDKALLRKNLAEKAVSDQSAILKKVEEYIGAHSFDFLKIGYMAELLDKNAEEVIMKYIAKDIGSIPTIGGIETMVWHVQKDGHLRLPTPGYSNNFSSSSSSSSSKSDAASVPASAAAAAADGASRDKAQLIKMASEDDIVGLRNAITQLPAQALKDLNMTPQEAQQVLISLAKSGHTADNAMRKFVNAAMDLHEVQEAASLAAGQGDREASELISYVYNELLSSLSSSSSSGFSSSSSSSVAAAAGEVHARGKEEEDEEGLEGFSKDKLDIGWVNPYFGKYTITALAKILGLRVGDVGLTGVEVIESLFVDQLDNNIESVISQIARSVEKTILAPLNLFNKHATGLIAKKAADGTVNITYFDPLNKPMPEELRKLIFDHFSSQVIVREINIKEIAVERQKYSNCGAEVIENFILYLTGKRVSQEKAIELHSQLVEKELLSKKSSGLAWLFDQVEVGELVPQFKEVPPSFDNLTQADFDESELLGGTASHHNVYDS